MSVVIVTGAARGIGSGIAEAFAKQGANVVLADLKKDECISKASELSAKYNVKTEGIKCDMSSQKDVANLVKEATKKFGQLDVFVNNAGIYPSKPLMEITNADWDLVLNVNLKGSFYSIQEAARAMQPGGKIVIISSIASIVAFPGLSHYCASKAGVNGLVRDAAVELAAKKINVNAVAPGAIDTPGATGSVDANAKAQMVQAIPWKRWGTPADIANAVVFLASPGADYITGQTLVVDGGWTLQ